jgi:hypothetical protein
MENTILPVLFAGVGNKLGSLFSAVILTEKFNKKLFVLNVNTNIGSVNLNSIFDFDYPYKDFSSFIEIDQLIDTSIPIYTTKSFNFKRKCLSHDSFNKYKLPHSFLYLSHKPRDISLANLNIFLQKFKINSKVKDQIDEFVQNNGLNKDVYGLHIRASDFPDRNENINYAKKFIESNQNKKIFICTDEKQVENDLSLYKNVFFRKKESYTKKLNIQSSWNEQQFDKKYDTINFNCSRDNECSIDAFIDMILLSKTNLSSSRNCGSTFFSWCEHFSRVTTP